MATDVCRTVWRLSDRCHWQQLWTCWHEHSPRNQDRLYPSIRTSQLMKKTGCICNDKYKLCEKSIASSIRGFKCVFIYKISLAILQGEIAVGADVGREGSRFPDCGDKTLNACHELKPFRWKWAAWSFQVTGVSHRTEGCWKTEP